MRDQQYLMRFRSWNVLSIFVAKTDHLSLCGISGIDYGIGCEIFQ